MSQRDSGYQRIERDAYQTPPWVTYAVIDYLPPAKIIWEPAAGEGKMADALSSRGYKVLSTDIIDDWDFLTRPDHPCCGIVTNPPYSHAYQFITTALDSVFQTRGFVAMLLPVAYDSAKSRKHLFDQPPHARKIILTQRITWVERTDGKKSQPSENHAWHIWDWKHKGPTTLHYY